MSYIFTKFLKFINEIYIKSIVIHKIHYFVHLLKCNYRYFMKISYEREKT